MNARRPAEDPLEVISRVRSATLQLGSNPAAPFERPRGSLARLDLQEARARADELTRTIFFAERAATPPLAARARVIWRGWAERLGQTLTWETRAGEATTPLVRESLGELGVLLSGPATRGELRALDSYEALFVHLFSIGWVLAEAANPVAQQRSLGDASERGIQVLEATRTAWAALRELWDEPWLARRRLDPAFVALARSAGRGG
jgi:hypothetical protein